MQYNINNSKIMRLNKDERKYLTYLVQRELDMMQNVTDEQRLFVLVLLKKIAKE